MDRQPILETERLVLRPLTETDREPLHAIGARWPCSTGATSACLA